MEICTSLPSSLISSLIWYTALKEWWATDSDATSRNRPAPSANKILGLIVLLLIDTDQLDCLLFRRAWRGTPAGSVGELPEIGARDIGLTQVLGIFDHDCDHEIALAAGGLVTFEVLGHHRVRAIRYAVFPKIARAHLRRDDFHEAASLRKIRICESWASPAGGLPLSDGSSLPGQFRARRRRWLRTKVEHTGLGA